MAAEDSNDRAPSWDPGCYLTFGDQRLRPALDLLGRVPNKEAEALVDLGCGPGNVTPFLRQRFPEAAIYGVDNSSAMLAKARQAQPNAIWIEDDIAAWHSERPLDVIYSNAALHWLPNHAELFPRLLEQLRPGGSLAVQMPDTGSGQWREELRQLAMEGPWAGNLAELIGPGNVLAPAAYHRLLAKPAQSLDIWRTDYLHVLEGDDAVFTWTSGAGARPFLDRLDGTQKDDFAEAYRQRLRAAYPVEPDGTTLLPFTRTFVVAVKA